MLSPSSATVVTSTLPAVRDHAEAITSTFYSQMFAAHPELLELFNRGNQATGRQRQALAAAVIAYAEHLIGQATTATWNPVVERIAHKHASLGVTPAQYPIVGRHLLGAITEVLGAAVTPAVAAAWDEVYWLFAAELTARETRLYQAAGVHDPGDVWQPWRVRDRIEETDDIVSLVLEPQHGGEVVQFTPGQYVSVAVDLGGARGRQIRQYSLSGRPGADTCQITVKRVRSTRTAPAGAVSTFLHEQVAVGDRLLLSAPFGDVSSVAGDGPLLLVSAGIGVTPAMSALEELAHLKSRRAVVFVHADRAGSTHALRRHLPRLSQAMPTLRLELWYEQHQPNATVEDGRTTINTGRVDPDRIPLAPDTRVHLCGPLPFMNQVRHGLLRRGVRGDRIGYEVFGPEMLRS